MLSIWCDAPDTWALHSGSVLPSCQARHESVESQLTMMSSASSGGFCASQGALETSPVFRLMRVVPWTSVDSPQGRNSGSSRAPWDRSTVCVQDSVGPSSPIVYPVRVAFESLAVERSMATR